MDFGWGDALSLLGGPIGYLGYQGYKKQQQGNEAQNAAMDQARAGLGDLQKSQRLQRGEDLGRALSMFGPVDDYMSRMYGVAKPPPFMSNAERAATSAVTMGKGRFGGNAPATPASPQAMLGGSPGPYRGANSGNMQTDPAVRAQMLAAQAAQQKRVRGY